MAKSDVLVRMKADVSNYDANIAKARRQLENFKKDNLSMSGILKQTSSSLLGMAAQYASVAAAIGAVGGAITSNIATARNFEKSMSQLSSLTGMVGADLAKLKDYAIELGSSTTLSASEVADAFKLIGSQQPQLLASGEALKAVTKNAITLSEAAGIDLATASQTLSTSINQMGGDSANAERYINVLAAASQKGAGDIAWLGEAITKSGTTAKAVGTDYEELVANLEQLAKAGFDASTAGTALRSIIMNLEKQANNDFKPSVVGLTQAFENLGKANLSIVGYQEIAGKMFASQAKALADASGEARDMTSAITGTNTAEEQAKTNTDNLEGSIKALSSAWEGFNLHLNSSNGLFRDIVDGLKDIVVWADNVIVKLGEIPNPENIITKSLQEVGSNVDANGNYIKRPAQKGAVGFDWEKGTWKQGYYGAIYNSVTGQTEFPEVEIVGNKKTKGGNKKTKGGKGGKTDPVYAKDSIAYQEKLVSDLTKKWKEAGDAVREGYAEQLGYAQQKLEAMKGGFDPTKIQELTDMRGTTAWVTSMADMKRGKDGKWYDATTPVAPSEIKFSDGLQKLMDYMEKQQVDDYKKRQSHDGWDDTKKVVSGLNQVASGLQQMGIELPKGVQQVLGMINGLMTVIEGVNTIIGVTQTTTLSANTAAMVALTSALYANTAVSAIPFFARGGVVKAAVGYEVPGNHFSGDMVPALLNSGETVLNRAQSGIIASALEGAGNGFKNGQIVGRIEGEKIVLVANHFLKRSGQGELLTWKN